MPVRRKVLFCFISFNVLEGGRQETFFQEGFLLSRLLVFYGTQVRKHLGKFRRFSYPLNHSVFINIGRKEVDQL